ncbi:hypothetical protein ACIBO2_31825 [Nonomuraea sp. NPDC050022]|uniref:hypothetical protein n=1 Tax=Nonomuraea sp. NPDC050022 TaxID=3364358 RepID=UPI00379CA10A
MVIRSALMYEGKQHLQFFAGIDAETVGARNICMHLQTIPASGSCRAHKHDHHETAIYVIKGAVGAWYGENPERYLQARQGEFIYRDDRVGPRVRALWARAAVIGTDCDISITYGKISVIERASDNQADREITSWIHRYDEAAGRAVTGRGDLPIGGSMKRQASRSTARAAYAAWTAAKAARESPPLQDEEHVKSPPVRRTCP